MAVDDLRDALARERLLPEPALDVVEDARVRRVRLVEDVLERQVRLPQPVTEVLREDPPAIYNSVVHSQRMSFVMKGRSPWRGVGGAVLTGVGRLLDGVVAAGALAGVEEGVVGEAVEEGRLLHDLEDRVLDWRGVHARKGVEVQRDDRNPV